MSPKTNGICERFHKTILQGVITTYRRIFLFRGNNNSSHNLCYVKLKIKNTIKTMCYHINMEIRFLARLYSFGDSIFSISNQADKTTITFGIFTNFAFIKNHNTSFFAIFLSGRCPKCRILSFFFRTK